MHGHIVLANSKKGFIANAIKWFTSSSFSHSLITIPDILGVPMGIEAAEQGVDAVRFDKNYINDPSQGYEVWRINIPQDVKDRAIVSLLNDLEIGYGFFQYPWFIWRKLNLFFGKDIKGQDNWIVSRFICSQLCVAYLRACGLERVLVGYGNGSVAPQDLQDIFKNNPKIFELIETKL